MISHVKLTSVFSHLLVALLLACRIYAQGGGSDTDPALKLHFDFEEDFSSGRVIDASGNGNDGWQFNPTNRILPDTGVFGTTGAQYFYNGTINTDPPRVHVISEYLAVTNVNGYYIMTNATISVWAWFDTNSDNSMYLLSAGYPQMYAFDQNAASNSWTINRNSSSYMSFITYPLGIYHTIVVSWPDDTIQPGGFTPNFGTTKFHMYTVTIDCPNNSAIAYYDGQPYMTNTIDLPWIRVYGTIGRPWLCVGAMGHDGTPEWGDDAYPNAGYFVGKMDEVRIYNRALAGSEVQALYYGSPLVKQLSIHDATAQSVQVCWSARSNTIYQVDYEASLNGTWSPLGAPIMSLGGTVCVTNLPPNATNGFYRVRALP